MRTLLSVSTLSFLVAFGASGCAIEEEAPMDETIEDADAIVGNLIKNGGFQNDFKFWKLDKGDKGAVIDRNTYTPCFGDGDCAWYLSLAGGKTEASSVEQTVPANAGQSFKLKFKAATDVSGVDPNHSVRIDFLNAAKERIGGKSKAVKFDLKSPCPDFDCGVGAIAVVWTPNTVTFEAPAGTAYAQIRLIGKASPPRGYGGPVLGVYDSVSLVKL